MNSCHFVSFSCYSEDTCMDNYTESCCKHCRDIMASHNNDAIPTNNSDYDDDEYIEDEDDYISPEDDYIEDEDDYISPEEDCITIRGMDA